MRATPTYPYIQRDVELKRYNTFGIDAMSRYLTTVQHRFQLKAVLENPMVEGVPKIIIGEGSNILFTKKNYDEIVIRIDVEGIEPIFETENHIWLNVGGGVNWHDFVLHCIKKGYGGVENLSLIPGSVGAAPVQNIGAYGVELKDILYNLEAMDLSTGETRTFKRDECKFGYRDSIFKNEYKDQYAILYVVFVLEKIPTRFKIEYGAIRETLESMQVKELSVRAISDAVIQIRESKLPDPRDIGNAGSFFKNPVVSSSHFADLKKDFAEMPSFPVEKSDTVKIPAAWLIEQCGWKGKRVGDIGVYEKQPLVLVNYEAGEGAAVLELAQQIQESVREKFNIELVPEVRVY